MTKKTKTAPLIGGKTLDQWDLEWQTVEGGFHSYRKFRGMAGLYRVTEGGVITAIGKGAGMFDRLDKRMYDLIRPGNSGRDHHIGRYINANLDKVEFQVLIVGKSWRDSVTAGKLKGAMIARHKPRENVPPSIVKRIAFG